ncbi:MAG: hypothetical protein ACR2JK_12065 [Geodermatophilaceae bacterium]
MEPEEVRIEPFTGDGADAVVTGEPSDLLLWLWGRLPTDFVQISGDAAAVERLTHRLTVVTD